MAKRKKKPTKDKRNNRPVAEQQVESQDSGVQGAASEQEIETSDVMLSEVKLSKKDLKKQEAEKKKNKKAKAQTAPKRSRVKEVFSELKKVNWPTFKQACKQTGAVLVVVAIFMLVVLGIDSLLGWIITLIGQI